MLFCSVKHEDKSDIYDLGVILLELILGRQIKTANDADAFRDLVNTGTVIHFLLSAFFFIIHIE